MDPLRSITTKQELKKLVKKSVTEIYPHHHDKFTDKNITLVYSYMEGYYDCLQFFVEKPYSDKEIKQFLHEAAHVWFVNNCL